jgi:hypothetical protein
MPPEQPKSAAFTVTTPDLLPILAELLAREPIFHHPTSAASLDDFARMLAPTYWEVGASGRRYSRDFTLQSLAANPPVDAASAGWSTFDPQCRRLGPDTYLFTYTLHQGRRRTRRATIWQRTPAGWQILYHQGTLIAAEEDDVAPPSVPSL